MKDHVTPAQRASIEKYKMRGERARKLNERIIFARDAEKNAKYTMTPARPLNKNNTKEYARLFDEHIFGKK